jgi:hypothetical protein
MTQSVQVNSGFHGPVRSLRSPQRPHRPLERPVGRAGSATRADWVWLYGQSNSVRVSRAEHPFVHRRAQAVGWRTLVWAGVLAAMVVAALFAVAHLRAGVQPGQTGHALSAPGASAVQRVVDGPRGGVPWARW